MGLHAISDLHLCGAQGARLFDDARQGRALAALCDRLLAEPGAELVLDGDVFDLTAMCPPARGLAAFGRALDFFLEDVPVPSLRERCVAVREGCPVALGALARLSERVPVTLVTGNHDRELGEAAGRAALDAAGLANVRLAPEAVRTLAGRTVVLLHGHAFDGSNEKPGGGGEIMTAVLHHAVVPFLRRQAGRANVRIDPDRVVSLRPEERVVPVLERWLPPGLFARFVDAFLELLVANGFVSRLEAFFATPARIRSRLRADDDLWETTGHRALQALGGELRLPGDPPPPDLLVLGHTHVPDWAVHEGRPGAQRLYVNLGTWTSRASDAAGPADVTLPELAVSASDGRLTAVLRDLSQDEELQRFSVT